jgi:hypothetical protein
VNFHPGFNQRADGVFQGNYFIQFIFHIRHNKFTFLSCRFFRSTLKKASCMQHILKTDRLKNTYKHNNCIFS